ncbi:IclR family transcriptional regulator C-terminal domain-containing protein [Streptomyces sp. NPDC001795]|uniref:IclR family transcriptional regulator domain-containing protein n=1 Tax=unclassified Streptomyces TaxID=2593676 RepID=UPI003332CEB2
MAHLSEPELDGRLAAPLERCTPQPVTDPGILRAQLKSARTDGCAYGVEELETGLNAVAAPVFTFNGQVVAALSASGPSFRLTEQRLLEVSALVQGAAEKISDRLGYLRRA